MFEAVAQRLNEKNVASSNIDGEAPLESRGYRLRKMLAQADGRVRLLSRDGTLTQVLTELGGLDIAEATGFLMAGDEPVRVRCMLADFDMQQGTLHPCAFVLDNT